MERKVARHIERQMSGVPIQRVWMTIPVAAVW